MQNTHRFLIILTIAVSFFLPSIANVYAAEVPTFTAKVGELKKITFKLAIPVKTPAEFAYAIQVNDEEGFADQLSLVQGSLEAGDYSPQQSWIPEKPGEFTVEIFIFTCIDCPSPFPDTLTMKVIVEE